VVDPKADDAVAAIKALTHGVGVDLAHDTSGAPEGRVVAVQATQPWGTVCFVGEGGGVTLDVSRDLSRNSVTLPCLVPSLSGKPTSNA
jgi:threonine dehydrogenase-like Zn-dependent dehydrogenase